MLKYLSILFLFYFILFFFLNFYFPVLWSGGVGKKQKKKNIQTWSTRPQSQPTQNHVHIHTYNNAFKKMTSYTLRRSLRIVFRFGDFPSREFATNTYCFGSLNS